MKPGGAIDSAGTLPTGATFANPVDLKRLLAGREADLARNLTERFMAYALGRPLERYDEVVLDQLMARIAEDGYRVRTILPEVITSDLFTHRRVWKWKKGQVICFSEREIGASSPIIMSRPIPSRRPLGDLGRWNDFVDRGYHRFPDPCRLQNPVFSLERHDLIQARPDRPW